MSKKWVFLVVASLLLVAPLVASAAGPDPGTGTSTVYVMNIESAAPAELAGVTAEYFKENDGFTGSQSASIPYAGHFAFVPEMTSPWSGSMVLSSTRQIGSVGLIEWTGGAGGDGKTAGGYSGFSAGANTAYAPSLFKRTYQSSKITIQNTDPSVAASVEVKFYNRGESTPVFTTNVSIPANTSTTLDVWDYAQIPTDLGGGTNNWTGAAVMTSTTQKIAAVVTTLWQGATNASSIYSGPATPTMTLYAPSVFKKLFAQWQIYTGIIIMNPNNTAANLTFYFYNRDGTLAIPAATKSIDPFSSDGFNTRYETTGMFDAIPNDWNGLAKITSNVPVVGIVNVIWKVPSDQTGSYTLLGPNDLTEAYAFYPVVTRKVVGSNWQKWTGIIFQNTSDTQATVTTEFHNPNGTLAVSIPSTVPGNGAAGWNTRYATELSVLPADWTGTVVVRSDRLLAGIANLVETSQAVSYEAIKP